MTSLFDARTKWRRTFLKFTADMRGLTQTTRDICEQIYKANFAFPALEMLKSTCLPSNRSSNATCIGVSGSVPCTISCRCKKKFNGFNRSKCVTEAFGRCLVISIVWRDIGQGQLLFRCAFYAGKLDMKHGMSNPVKSCQTPRVESSSLGRDAYHKRQFTDVYNIQSLILEQC